MEGEYFVIPNLFSHFTNYKGTVLGENVVFPLLQIHTTACHVKLDDDLVH